VNRLNSSDTRGACAARAIEELAANWPAIKDSHWYFGGSSGGGENSCFLAVFLCELFEHPPHGFFMGGCGQLKMIDAIEIYESKKDLYQDAAFFLSHGDEDEESTAKEVREVARQLKKEHFKNVRQEVFEGGSELNREHLMEALEWFDKLRK